MKSVFWRQIRYWMAPRPGRVLSICLSQEKVLTRSDRIPILIAKMTTNLWMRTVIAVVRVRMFQRRIHVLIPFWNAAWRVKVLTCKETKNGTIINGKLRNWKVKRWIGMPSKKRRSLRMTLIPRNAKQLTGSSMLTMRRDRMMMMSSLRVMKAMMTR